jgi:hypothetical protein
MQLSRTPTIRAVRQDSSSRLRWPQRIRARSSRSCPANGSRTPHGLAPGARAEDPHLQLASPRRACPKGCSESAHADALLTPIARGARRPRLAEPRSRSSRWLSVAVRPLLETQLGRSGGARLNSAIRTTIPRSRAAMSRSHSRSHPADVGSWHAAPVISERSVTSDAADARGANGPGATPPS